LEKLWENNSSCVNPSKDFFLSEVNGCGSTFLVFYITDIFSTQPRKTVLLWLKHLAGAWKSGFPLCFLSQILGLTAIV